MANLKISELTAASTLAAADLVPVVQGGTTKKATVTQVRGPTIQGSTPIISAAAVGLGTSLAAVPGSWWVLPLVPGSGSPPWSSASGCSGWT